MSIFDDCDSMLDVVDLVKDEIDSYLVKNMTRVGAEKLGLDERCGTVWVDNDNRVIVCTRGGSRGIDYYGGFENIKEGEGRTTLGRYVIYHGDDRVEDCFDHILEEDLEG